MVNILSVQNNKLNLKFILPFEFSVFNPDAGWQVGSLKLRINIERRTSNIER